MESKSTHGRTNERESPSTGYFVLFLCVLLVLAGLFVMGVIPGWLGE